MDTKELLELLKGLKPENINAATQALEELVKLLQEREKAESESIGRRKKRIADERIISELEEQARERAQAIIDLEKEKQELQDSRNRKIQEGAGFSLRERELNEEEQLAITAKISKLNEEIVAIENKNELLKKAIENVDKAAEEEINHSKALEESRKKIEAVRKELAKYEIQAGNTADEVKELKDEITGVDEQLNTIQQALGKSLGGQQGGFLGQIYRSATSAVDSMKSLSAAAQNAGGMGELLSNSMARANRTLASVGGMAGLAGLAVLGFMAKLSLEINNLSKELGAATGFGDKFNNEIARMGQKGMMAGIGFAESADALTKLTEGLSSFNPNAEATNEYVGMTVARLAKLGVGSAKAVESIDHLQRSMGMSAKAAADMTAEIARMGKEIGITGTKMINDFVAQSGRLAIFGQKGTQVFKELAAAAKATGIQMATLVGIAKKFDTFEAAATQVSQLNAILGTQLSSLEMLQASDSERILMLKQQVQMSVGNFENLDKFTKMYVAQAMGAKDVAEAQRILNMSTAEYQKYTAGQQEAADVQAELAEATEKVVPVMQQLKLAGLNLLMVFKPIITTLSGVIAGVSALVRFITKLGDAFEDTSDQTSIALEVLAGSIMIAAIAWKAFGVNVAFATGGLSLIIPLIASLMGVWSLTGSPANWEMPMVASKGYENLANSMGAASQAATATSMSLKKVHDSMHEAGGKSFNIEAMAKLDTEKIASGLTKVKSAMMELSTLKIDGFLAMSTDGAKSSIVMGSQGVIKSLSEGRLAIDVNMPEIALPPINVVVKVNDANLAGVIDARVEKKAIT